MQTSQSPSLIQTASAAFEAASPDVQAALVGNFGIVLGAMITVVVTAVIATRQFRHERVEKTKDRALEIKKEVLLDGVRGAQQLLSGIASFSNLSRAPEQITSDIQSGIGLMTVAGAVASQKTVEAGRALVEAAGPVVIEFIGRRKPLDEMQHELQIIQKQIDQVSGDNRMVLELQRQAIMASHDDEAKFHSSVFEENHKHFMALIDARDSLIRSLERKQVPLVREAVEAQARLSEKLRELIAQVRIDMGIDSDPLAYLNASYVDPGKAQRAVDKLLAQILDK